MATEQTFQTQIIKTLAFEGGYGNDPDDPGGETNFGISKAAYPDEDIANMTQERAIEIYHADYWLAPKINELPDSIAGKVFDMGVNMGPHTAIRLMQDTLNDYGTTTPELVEDGRIGPLTIAAANASPATFLSDYRNTLIAHYNSLIANHAALAKFRNGWIRRANA